MNTTALDTIALNHDAVYLMRHGCYQQAISVFRTALHGSILQPDEDKDLANTVTHTSLSIRSVPLEASLALFSSSSYQDHHTFSLFDRALVIDDAELAAASSIAGQNSTAVVVLFNMGLAYQLQGMQDLRSQQTNFKKAMSFYNTATEILDRCTAYGDDVNGLLYLAVSNNLGHIYSHFCETAVVQRCLEWLNLILESMQRFNLHTAGNEYLPFHLNVLILRGQYALAAGAA
jgi:tetratricopeptide (TPR) repeat protein